jgi:hypothetical protein
MQNLYNPFNIANHVRACISILAYIYHFIGQHPFWTMNGRDIEDFLTTLHNMWTAVQTSGNTVDQPKKVKSY